MKTITEFNGFSLRDAFQKKTAIAKDVTAEITAQGKAGEELTAAVAAGIQEKLGVELKLEGDKLKYFLAALELTQGKDRGLKRVVVLTAAEGEKAPPEAKEKEGTYYLVEYFPAPPEQKHGRREGARDAGRRGRGGKGGGRGGDQKRSRGGGRPDDGPGAGRDAAGGGAGGGRGDGRPPAGGRDTRRPSGGRGGRPRAPGYPGSPGANGPQPQMTEDGKKVFTFKKPDNRPAKPVAPKTVAPKPESATENPKE
jgi:hypothetical protein